MEIQVVIESKKNRMGEILMSKVNKRDISHLGSRARNNVNMFDYLKERYNISKAWLASEMGISRQSFQEFEETGFPPDRLDQIQDIINKMGDDLKDLRLPASLAKKEAA